MSADGAVPDEGAPSRRNHARVTGSLVCPGELILGVVNASRLGWLSRGEDAETRRGLGLVIDGLRLREAVQTL